MGFGPEDLFIFILEITSRIVEIGGFPDWGPLFLRSQQDSQKFVDYQEDDGGKLYFFHLARGKGDKNG